MRRRASQTRNPRKVRPVADGPEPVKRWNALPGREIPIRTAAGRRLTKGQGQGLHERLRMLKKSLDAGGAFERRAIHAPAYFDTCTFQAGAKRVQLFFDELPIGRPHKTNIDLGASAFGDHVRRRAAFDHGRLHRDGLPRVVELHKPRRLPGVWRIKAGTLPCADAFAGAPFAFVWLLTTPVDRLVTEILKRLF